jgi:hypothetical protein
MAKQIDPAKGLDRQTGAILNAEKSAAYNVVLNEIGLAECYPEQLESFINGLCQIAEDLDNRLVGQIANTRVEVEIDREPNLAFVFERAATPKMVRNVGKLYVFHYRAAAAIDDREGVVTLGLCRSNQQAMLVNFVEFGEGPECVVSSLVSVGLDVFKDQSFSVGETGLYRSLRNGVFQVLPRLVEGKRGEIHSSDACSFGFGGSAESAPGVVQTCPKIMDSVARDQRDGDFFSAERLDASAPPPFTIRFEKSNGSARILELIDHRYKLVDVLAGPL